MLHPISFSIPKEKIVKTDVIKNKIISDMVPGKKQTYIYKDELSYYEEYRSSCFAYTTEKHGWDCLRHYEILANGCIPVFLNIENCPTNTLTSLPKELLLQGNDMYFSGNYTSSEYATLARSLLDYTNNYLTTIEAAKYILNVLGMRITQHLKILFLSNNICTDYLRCLTLHGFKELLGLNCHDYKRIPHLYKTRFIVDDKYIETNLKYNLYGRGFTYTNLLDSNLHCENLNLTINEDIKKNYYDLVIYGSYCRGMPLYELVCKHYDPKKIVLLYGEDMRVSRERDHSTFLKKGHNIFVRELR